MPATCLSPNHPACLVLGDLSFRAALSSEHPFSFENACVSCWVDEGPGVHVVVRLNLRFAGIMPLVPLRGFDCLLISLRDL